MAKRTKADKQKSTVSKESGSKATSLKTEQTRMSLTKERTKSPKRMTSGGRKTSVDAGRGSAAAATSAAAAAAVVGEATVAAVATYEQAIEEEPEDETPTPETLAEKLCLAKIYANTYCLLGRMVESIADVCESVH